MLTVALLQAPEPMAGGMIQTYVVHDSGFGITTIDKPLQQEEGGVSSHKFTVQMAEEADIVNLGSRRGAGI